MVYGSCDITRGLLEPLMAGRCKECRHFEPNAGCPGFGDCRKVFLGRYFDVPGDGYARSLVFINDNLNCGNGWSMWVGEEFGCVHWDALPVPGP